MPQKVSITIEGDLSLATAVVEGQQLDLKPISNQKWQGSKNVDIDDLIEVRWFVKGPYLAKYTVTTGINNQSKSWTGHVRYNDRLTNDGVDYLPSDFGL